MNAEIYQKLSGISLKTYGNNEQTDCGNCCKKILIATTHSLDLGGAPLALLSLLKLISEEYEIYIISPADGLIGEKFAREGFNVFVILPEECLSEDFLSILKMADLYLCNTILSSFYVRLAYDTNIPTVWWIHENREYFEHYKEYISTHKCTSANIQAVAVSARARDDVEKVLHIKCGLLHISVNDCIKQNVTRDKTLLRVFMPANFLYIKGHDIAAKAITLLPDEYSEKMEFMFAGDTDNSDKQAVEIVKLIERSYSNVKMLGKLSHDDVIRYLAESDVLLAPSRIDTLPTTAIEGMMMSKACLVSDSTGISKYIDSGKNGYVFESGNPEALARKLMEIKDAGDGISSIGSAGRKIYEENFTPEVCRRMFIDTVKSIEKRMADSNKKRLVFVVGEIDILDIFSYKMKDYFTSVGYDVLVVNLKTQVESIVDLLQFVIKPVKAMITFNCNGMNFELERGVNFWDQWNIPCINILMDHPFCYHENIEASPREAIVLCVDRNHMNYITQYYPEVPICGYLPHGGIELDCAKKPIKDRTIDVLYVGGLSRNYAYQIMPDFTKYDEFDARQLCEDVYAHLIENTAETLENAMILKLNERGLHYSYDKIREIIADLHVVDLLVVSYFREMAVRKVAESGINIEIYGNGWEKCEWINRPNVHYGGRISANEAVEKMLEAKIVLNTMTWFKDGTHDRVFNGMLQRALTVSDVSGYFEEEFVSVKSVCDTDKAGRAEMLLFELDKTDEIIPLIKYYLDNPGEAQIIADNGYKKARECHTWEARCDELINDLFDVI